MGDARSGEGDYGKDPRGLRRRPHVRWSTRDEEDNAAVLSEK
jgi:hypothetical protein